MCIFISWLMCLYPLLMSFHSQHMFLRPKHMYFHSSKMSLHASYKHLHPFYIVFHSLYMGGMHLASIHPCIFRIFSFSFITKVMFDKVFVLHLSCNEKEWDLTLTMKDKKINNQLMDIFKCSMTYSLEITMTIKIVASTRIFKKL